MSIHVKYSFHVVAVAAIWCAATCVAGQTVSEVAVAHPTPPGGPRHSDVCFSIRSLSRKNIDPFEVIKTFHGMRFDWVYANERFIKECIKRGYPTCNCTTASRTDLSKSVGKPASYQVGRAEDIYGKPLIASWQKWNPSWGCVNNPDFADLLFHDVNMAIAAGATYMHIDDPDTAPMVRWGGDKSNSETRGCFCPHCLAAFREYLAKQLKPRDLQSLKIRDVGRFDYKQYLLDGHRNKTLRTYYEDSYRRSVKTFWQAMMKRADERAGRHFPFACNNGSFTKWDSPIDLFDFAVGELSENDPPTPQSLWRKSLIIDSRNKAQVYTLRSTDPSYNRRVMCLAYALGNHFLAPWDVWIGGFERLYGKPQDYNDVYAFVRANARWLDKYDYAAAAGQGLRDSWCGNRPPVAVEGNADAYAFVRAVAGNPTTPAVIHLIDWGQEAKPFALVIDPSRFFPGKTLDFQMLTPVQHGPLAHEAAEKSGDFSKFSQCVPVSADPSGGRVRIAIPKLNSWAILIVSPRK